VLKTVKRRGGSQTHGEPCTARPGLQLQSQGVSAAFGPGPVVRKGKDHWEAPAASASRSISQIAGLGCRQGALAHLGLENAR